MIKKVFLYLSYILLFFNTNLFTSENSDSLKIGLLAPFTGEYRDLGNSLLRTTQLAIEEINDKKIIIIPRDSGSNDTNKMEMAINEIINKDVKVIIGPMLFDEFSKLEKYKNIIFLSLSNKRPEIKNNIISIGISLESQIMAIEKFIIKKNKKKTIIMYPKNEYTKYIDERIKFINLKNYKIFKYSPDPKILTGEIEKLTNYAQRKRNLTLRKKMLEKKEDISSKRELKDLEQKYTLGNLDFDSVIIIDFGNNLKSVLASLVFTDVNDTDVLFTTVNQWFDKSIFYENTVKNLYYPSVNYKNFEKFKKDYFETFNLNANEITILGYDAVGLIYYVWKKNDGINTINDFFIKDKIKGKIGNFKFSGEKILQELKIYKTENNKFIEAK
jgi:ABC-type branched-subunit amino acid transport system substrate-binding protein